MWSLVLVYEYFRLDASLIQQLAGVLTLKNEDAKISYVTFDEEINLGELRFMSNTLLSIMATFFIYCHERELPCKITSIKEPFPNRESRTHEEGRAFDASIQGWPDENIEEIVKKISREYGWAGAHSISDGKQRVVLYHKVEDSEYHLHFQVQRGL